jgi:hypothetical protein
MGSIAGTLNSLNSSLLSEIQNYNSTPTQTSARTSSNSSTTASDTVDFSQVSQLFQDLKQLETSNPTEFKQVTTDAANQLRAAASQTTDPQQAAFLNNLAERFQTAATTGNLSALEPSSSSTSMSGDGNGYRPHGHHHHVGGDTSTTGANQSQVDTTASSTVTS